MTPIIFAQIDPVSKAAIDQLAQGAITGGAVWVLSASSVVLSIAVLFLGKSLLIEKDKRIADAAASKAEIGDMHKTQSSVLQEILVQIRSSKGGA